MVRARLAALLHCYRSLVGFRPRCAGMRARLRVQWRGQRLLQRVEHELMYALALAEAYLALGRVNVYVHRFGRDVEEQHKGRMALAVQDVLVGLPHCVRKYLVAHEAAVHEEILRVARGARIGGERGPATQAQVPSLLIHADRVMRKFVAEQGGNA